MRMACSSVQSRGAPPLENHIHFLYCEGNKFKCTYPNPTIITGFSIAARCGDPAPGKAHRMLPPGSADAYLTNMNDARRGRGRIPLPPQSVPAGRIAHHQAELGLGRVLNGLKQYSERHGCPMARGRTAMRSDEGRSPSRTSVAGYCPRRSFLSLPSSSLSVPSAIGR
jgi:hypothetical protein